MHDYSWLTPVLCLMHNQQSRSDNGQDRNSKTLWRLQSPGYIVYVRIREVRSNIVNSS